MDRHHEIEEEDTNPFEILDVELQERTGSFLACLKRESNCHRFIATEIGSRGAVGV